MIHVDSGPRIQGWRAILAVLAEHGWEMSRFQALRFSLRHVNPLPIDGPERGQWSTRRALVQWIEHERKRLNRTPLTDEKPHKPRMVLVPHEAHKPHKR